METNCSTTTNVPNEPNSRTDLAKKQTDGIRLVDVNDFCLGKILRFLNLTDLTNVAESNTRLADVAKNIYSSYYQDEKVNLSRFVERSIALFCPELCYNTKFIVYNGDISQNALKHFGKYMKSIGFIQTSTGPQIPLEYHLITSISKYCKENLKELHIYLCGYVMSELFNDLKPFIHLEKLTISMNPSRIYPGLRYLIWDYNRIFPNLLSLEITDVPDVLIFLGNMTTRSFTHLEHFGLNQQCRRYKYIPAMHKIAKLNPQLRSLCLQCDDQQETELALSTLPHIDSLSLRVGHYCRRGRLDFGNVRNLKIACLASMSSKTQRSIDYSYFRVPLPAQLEKLETECLSFTDQLISQCSNLKSLTCLSHEIGKNEIMSHVDRIVRCLTQLQEVECIDLTYYNKLSARTDLSAFILALFFMQKCNDLRKAVVCYELTYGYKYRRGQISKLHEEELFATFGGDWQRRWQMTTEFKYKHGHYNEPFRCFTVSLVNLHNNMN